MEHFDWLKGFVFPYLNFALFLFLFIKFFRKPLAEMAKTRRDNFEKMLADASKAKEQALRQSQEISVRLNGLDKEINAQVESAKKAAQMEAQQIVNSARDLATHMKAEAKRIADAEIERAKDALREEIISTVKENVECKLKNDLVLDRQKELVHAKVQHLKEMRLGECN